MGIITQLKEKLNDLTLCYKVNKDIFEIKDINDEYLRDLLLGSIDIQDLLSMFNCYKPSKDGWCEYNISIDKIYQGLKNIFDRCHREGFTLKFGQHRVSGYYEEFLVRLNFDVYIIPGQITSDDEILEYARIWYRHIMDVLAKVGELRE